MDTKSMSRDDLTRIHSQRIIEIKIHNEYQDRAKRVLVIDEDPEFLHSINGALARKNGTNFDVTIVGPAVTMFDIEKYKHEDWDFIACAYTIAITHLNGLDILESFDDSSSKMLVTKIPGILELHKERMKERKTWFLQKPAQDFTMRLLVSSILRSNWSIKS